MREVCVLERGVCSRGVCSRVSVIERGVCIREMIILDRRHLY